MMDKELKRDANLKAEKLISDFMPHVYYNMLLPAASDRLKHQHLEAKHCALIAVDLLIEEEMMWQNGNPEPVYFWQDVKKELENL